MVRQTNHPSDVQDRIPHEHPALARCATVISLSVCQPACLTVLRRPLLLWDPWRRLPQRRDGRTADDGGGRGLGRVAGLRNLTRPRDDIRVVPITMIRISHSNFLGWTFELSGGVSVSSERY